MVGICGAIGEGGGPIDDMAESLAWTGSERSSRFDDSTLRLRCFTHRSRRGENPGRAPGGALVWVCGNVHGYREGDTYRSLGPDHADAPAFCARRYEEDGLEFVSRLNGDFVGVVYDREQATVSVFTDRLGTWPLYVTETEDGDVIFSSHAQSLARYPGLSLAFDEAYVVQHLSSVGGPFGVKTPLRGVESFPSGTVTTYDLEAGSTTKHQYWRPSFSSDDEFDDYDTFVDAFVDRFQSSVAERTWDRSKRYGILLSGGSDSRLVLAALPDDLDITAYHMADWMSKEARVAERVAITKGIDFRLLRRDPEYFGRVLDRSPRLWNFVQLFNQAWADGFIDEIRSEVDVLFTGHFSDTLFKGYFVPQQSVDLGPLGTYDTLSERRIETLAEFTAEFGFERPSYVDSTIEPAEVFERNVTQRDGTVESYGVEFESLRQLTLGWGQVPATTDSFFRQSLRENLELQMPLFDTRLLDLWDKMPIRYQLRRDVVNSVVTALDPELAAVPHATSGLSVRRSKPVHRFGGPLMNALDRLSPFSTVPAEHLDQRPWGNHTELIRTESYVEDAIYRAEDLIRSLPFLDWEGVVACYQDHLDGADNAKLLYRLVTFLEAPVTRRIAASHGSADTASTRGEPGRPPDE